MTMRRSPSVSSPVSTERRGCCSARSWARCQQAGTEAATAIPTQQSGKERRMLTAQDDLIGHQTPAPFAKSGAGDPRFTERYWYTAHPIDGTELLLDVGLGYYPNRNVMDGFAGITIGRRQH